MIPSSTAGAARGEAQPAEQPWWGEAPQATRRRLLAFFASSLALTPALDLMRSQPAGAAEGPSPAGPQALEGAVKEAVEKALADTMEKSKVPPLASTSPAPIFA